MHATPKGHIIQLDGIRFIAVALVLVDHLIPGFIPYGPLGVTVFFVLSGFLISRILLLSRAKFEGQPGGFRKYLTKFLIRRTIRIFPVYYLCILVLWLLDVPPVRDHLSWLVFYGTNIYIAYFQTWMGSVDHFWSLAVEEQVYLFFPFFLFFVPRNSILISLALMGLFSIALRAYFYYSGQPWFVSYVSMPACLDSFAIGGFMAWLQLYKMDLFKKIFSKSWPVLVGALAWGLLHYYSHFFASTKYNFANVVADRFVSSIFCFFLIGRGVMGYTGIIGSFLENGISVYLGKISYGIYLYHNFVYNHYHSGPNHPVTRLLKKTYELLPELQGSVVFEFTVVVVLTIFVAAISWEYFEKPINALKDKFAK